MTDPDRLPDLARPDEQAQSFLFEIVEQRSRLTRQLLSRLGVAALLYAGVLVLRGLQWAAGELAAHGGGVPAPVVTVSFSAGTGATLVTGLITASIAFNVLVVGVVRQRFAVQDDPARAARVISRLMLAATASDVIAVLAGAVGISVFFHGFGAGPLDLMGAAVSVLLAVVAAILAIDSADALRAEELRSVVGQEVRRAEARRLYRARAELLDLEDSRAVLGPGVQAPLPLVEVKTDPVRRRVLRFSAVCVIAAVPAGLLLGIYRFGAGGGLLDTAWRAGIVVLLMGVVNAMVLAVLISGFTDAVLGDWPLLVSDVLLFVSLLLVLLLIGMNAVDPPSAVAATRLAAAAMALSVLMTCLLWWRGVRAQQGPATWVRDHAAARVVARYNQLVVDEPSPAPRKRRRFQKTRDWFSGVSGRGGTPYTDVRWS